MLACRDHSAYELSQKLVSKYPKHDQIAQVVADLHQAGLINEQRFVENYIYWRCNRGYGPLRIQQELRARGVPDAMIASALNITDNAWFAGVRKVWQKHCKGRFAADYRLKAKQMRFLQYRGFTSEHIASVMAPINTDDD